MSEIRTTGTHADCRPKQSSRSRRRAAPRCRWGRAAELAQLDAIFTARWSTTRRSCDRRRRPGRGQDAPGRRVAGAAARAPVGGDAGRPRVYRGRAARAPAATALVSRLLLRSLRHPGGGRRGDAARAGAHAADRRVRRPPHGRGDALPRALTSICAHRATTPFIRAISRSTTSAPRRRDRAHGAAPLPRARRRALAAGAGVRRPAARRRRLADPARRAGRGAGRLAGGAGGGAAPRAVRAARPTGAAAPSTTPASSCAPLAAPTTPRQLLRELLARAEPLPDDAGRRRVRADRAAIRSSWKSWCASSSPTAPSRSPGRRQSVAHRSARAGASRAAHDGRGGDRGAHRRAVAGRARPPGEGGDARQRVLAGRAGGAGAARARCRRARERTFAVEERARIEAALEELVERDYLLRMPDSTVPGRVRVRLQAQPRARSGRQADRARARRAAIIAWPRSGSRRGCRRRPSRPASSSSFWRRSTSEGGNARRAAER